jgi:hypothetical protein
LRGRNSGQHRNGKTREQDLSQQQPGHFVFTYTESVI